MTKNIWFSAQLSGSEYFERILLFTMIFSGSHGGLICKGANGDAMTIKH